MGCATSQDEKRQKEVWAFFLKDIFLYKYINFILAEVYLLSKIASFFLPSLINIITKFACLIFFEKLILSWFYSIAKHLIVW